MNPCCYCIFLCLSLLCLYLQKVQQRTTGPRSPRERRSTRSNRYLWYHGSVSEAGLKWVPPPLCRMCSTQWMSRRAGGTGWDLWILLRDKAADLNLEKEKWLGKINKEEWERRYKHLWTRATASTLVMCGSRLHLQALQLICGLAGSGHKNALFDW